MHSGRIQKVVEMLVIVAIVLAGFGSAVLHLWNLLVPGIFGLRPINYWEALGLLGLSWILFGGLRGWGGWEPRSRTHWEQMSPDERQRLIKGLQEFGARHTQKP